MNRYSPVFTSLLLLIPGLCRADPGGSEMESAVLATFSAVIAIPLTLVYIIISLIDRSPDAQVPRKPRRTLTAITGLTIGLSLIFIFNTSRGVREPIHWSEKKPLLLVLGIYAAGLLTITINLIGRRKKRL